MTEKPEMLEARLRHQSRQHLGTPEGFLMLEAANALASLRGERDALTEENRHLRNALMGSISGPQFEVVCRERDALEARVQVLSDFARTAPGRLPQAIQDALAPWRPAALTPTEDRSHEPR